MQGASLLQSPYLNKGSAFTEEERKEFNLTGRLPTSLATLDVQAKRAYKQYSNCADDRAKNSFMTSMSDQNVVLYYRVSHFSQHGNALGIAVG